MDSFEPKSLAVPLAVIIASSIVAVVIFFNSSSSSQARLSTNQSESVTTELKAPVSIPSNSDFILGSPNAPIVIATYTNLSCSECERLYDNIFALMTRHGDTGSVSWMMRPYSDLSNNSNLTAQAFCVGETHSNQTFWKFTRDVMDAQKRDEIITDTTAQRLAESIDVQWDQVESCLSTNYYSSLLENSVEEIRNSGAQQTPSTVVFVGSEQISIPNGLSYPALETLITQLLVSIPETN